MNRSRLWLDFIGVKKAFFVLTFVYSGLIFSTHGRVPVTAYLLTGIAAICALVFAVGVKKRVDLKIDYLHPRKKEQPLIGQDIPESWVWGIIVLSLVLLLLCAAFLGRTLLAYVLVCLPVLGAYSFIKRFYHVESFVLGCLYGFAVCGGCLAGSGEFKWQLLLLAAGIASWTSALSVLASLEDIDFYKTHGLKSIGSVFGRQTAYFISRVCQCASLVLLIGFGILYNLGVVYWAGIGIITVIYLLVHKFYLEEDRSFPQEIFFTITDWLAVFFLFIAFMETFR